ncbi:UbiA family prenyltransferase [bacterium]|nr:UbiA family prenyltransferase [bacterium]
MHSNSSEPGSSSKSPSSRAPESISNVHFPIWLFPVLWGVLGVVAQTRLCFRAASIEILPVIAALISSVTLIFGGMMLFRYRAASESRETVSAKSGYILLVIGGLVGFFGGVLFGLWTLAAALVIWLYSSIPQRFAIMHHLLLALLTASLFLGTAMALNRLALAAYPAAFAFFFFLAWETTRVVETSRVDAKNGRVTIATLLGPRATLAIGGILFFLFGIITTWPFLNGLYSKFYFWIIVLVVDLPLLWMWGKLRGRDKELSTAAIARFNRIARWLIFIILIALLFA